LEGVKEADPHIYLKVNLHLVLSAEDLAIQALQMPTKKFFKAANKRRIQKPP
jgi:hypothetical protein